MARKVYNGRPFPLGATWEGDGTNFAVYSENADKIELCLFDETAGETESECIPLQEMTGHVWHAFLPGITPGQLYGYRAHGPFDPANGLRFNPAKLLIDPYAKAISGKVDWEEPVFPYKMGEEDADLTLDDRDDSRGMPKSVVVYPFFDWEGDSPPRTPWNRTIIYETHVKGISVLHPELPEDIRGTYAGLASQPIIDHFKELGITAVELLPVHDFLDDKHLMDKGLHNYWGYNTTNFFSPTAFYSSSGDTGGQVSEFQRMVKRLHQADIEVILDVVYNHTSEGNHLGPMLSFKGIDNTTYYRLVQDNRRYYMDYTGTGNSPNMLHPQVLKIIMDSLRYWVEEMHVDGFRFDLAATLARELHDVDRLSAFFDVIHQDPVISRVKLIAEPWDVGEGGYQVGNFPILWTEWNGKYRDDVRKFWKGDEGQVDEIAYRLAGSSDLYEGTGRRPRASINFVTAHDGFTLHDLVSYNEKHNEANGEDNRDGSSNNDSWNCGAEGPTDDPGIIALREKQKRNFMATLLLSQGVPMICGGDEIGRTQNGNNNGYCQDNEISWYDWDLDERQKALFQFVKDLIKLRLEHPVLHRRKFFQGRKIRGMDIKDIMWLRTDGKEMSDEDWKASWVRCFGMLLAGEMPSETDFRGNPVRDDTLLVLLNSYHEPIDFQLAPPLSDMKWDVKFATSDAPCLADGEPRKGTAPFEMTERCSGLLIMKE